MRKNERLKGRGPGPGLGGDSGGKSVPSPEDPVGTELIRRWRRHPDLFVLEAIGATPTNQQTEALIVLGDLAEVKCLMAAGLKVPAQLIPLKDKIGITIRSGHGTGKDGFLSWVYIWLLICFPYPRGLVTAPTAPQLNAVLWPEIRKWLRKSKGELWRYVDINSERLYLKDAKEEWFVAPRTATITGGEDEQAETLAGLHADYMIHAVDEASGVPNGVFKPFEGAQTGKMNLAVLIGNMTRATGYFYDSHFKDRKYWVALHWSCEDSNMDEVTGLTSMAQYVQRIASKYGKDSNMYRIRVQGNPPISDPDALIPLEWVMDAVEREVEVLEDEPLMTGIDVGAGGDPSIILHRKGMRVLSLQQHNTKDTMELTGWAALTLSDVNSTAALVDVIGLGNGVYNRLRELGFRAYAVNVAEVPSRKDRFSRLRDELFWKLRELFERRVISIPKDDELIGELASIRYKPESSGKIKIESKAEMRARGLESPNKADALMLTLFLNDRIFHRRKEKKDAYDFGEDTEPVGKRGWMGA